MLNTQTKGNKPQSKLVLWLWFLLVLSACTSDVNPSHDRDGMSKASSEYSVQESTQKADIPDTLPDFTAKTVVKTSTIAIKNTAQYATQSHLPYANPNAYQGGTLSMATTGTFNSLNPFIDKGVPATGTFYLYDTLMAGSLDESYVLYPQLATHVSYDTKDNSWVMYHIHPNARFWDGSRVTAHDVKATFEAILSKGLMSWRGFLTGIRSIIALDDERVLFYFDDGASRELYASIGLMPVMAKADIERRFEEVSFVPLMGSGAYQVADIDPAHSISYRKNDEYWGKEVMVNQGRFNFQTIKFLYYQDDTVAFEAFKAGQVNFRSENDVKKWINFQPETLNLPIVKHAVMHTNPVTMQGLVMNIRRPIFTNRQVRQAVGLAFDWQWTNAQLLHGYYERLTSYFYGSSLMAHGKPDATEREILASLPLNEDEKTALLGIPKTLTDNSSLRERLLTARQLLLQAGFFYRAGQLFDTQGNRASIEILLADDKYQAIILAYKKNLSRLGFLVTIRRMDTASYLHKKRQFEYDMIVDEFMQGNSPGVEQAYLWGSQSANQIGNQNTIGIQSDAIDELINRLTQAKTRQEIEWYAKVLDRLLLAGEYMIPWGGKNTTNVMYHKTITPPDRLPSAAIGLDYWYFQPPH